MLFHEARSVGAGLCIYDIVDIALPPNGDILGPVLGDRDKAHTTEQLSELFRLRMGKFHKLETVSTSRIFRADGGGRRIMWKGSHNFLLLEPSFVGTIPNPACSGLAFIKQKGSILHGTREVYRHMAQSVQIDDTDRKILSLLQEDARLTNNDLSERVNLSASQCSRRRQKLEEEGVIKAYRAILDRDRLGHSLVNIISVTLATHNRDNARRFAELVSRLPEVQDAYALTGEMDYILKVVTPDLKSLSDFVNEVLLPHESVQHVKTAIVLQALKEHSGIPI
jgi:DNA-binding Lrp family transcriptional regulator